MQDIIALNGFFQWVVMQVNLALREVRLKSQRCLITGYL